MMKPVYTHLDIVMHRATAIAIAIAAISLTASSQPNPTDDFFSLAVGKRWTYNYTLTNIEYTFITSDSGTASYTLLAVGGGSDTVTWAVREVRNAIRRNPNGSTSYVHDSVMFSLAEVDSGNHQFWTFGYVGNWPGYYRSRAWLLDNPYNGLRFFRFITGVVGDTFIVNYEFPWREHLKVWFQRNRGPIEQTYGFSVAHYSLTTHYTLVEVSPTSAHEEKQAQVRIHLGQNYPNPFNPSTRISFQLSATSFVTLKVFDVLGREVATLVNEEMRPGSYERMFHAQALASGIYICKLKAGSSVHTRKLVFLR